MEEQILKRIYESLNEGKSVAMAVITEEIGSSPRKSGSMMAIWEDGTIFGTIGGGKIEYTIIQKAISCIEKHENHNFSYQLTEKGIGMQCGGSVKGYIKVFQPKSRLIIVGAGHIGEKLYKLGQYLNFSTVIIDSRKQYANKTHFPDASQILVGDVKELLSNYHLTDQDYVVIASSSHEYDKDALKAVVNESPSYIGMIGSAKKVRHIMKSLIDEGIEKDKLQKVYAPIGLNISTNSPNEIAFGVMSEILLIKNNGTLNHRKNLKKVWD